VDYRWVSESIDRGIDPLSGARIFQLTSSSSISYGIYCEQIYASTDGARAAFIRLHPSGLGRGPHEIWVCDLTTRQVAFAGLTSRTLAASTPLIDSVYYVRPEGESDNVLVRLDLKTLDRADVFRFGDCPLPAASTISPDERWFVAGLHVRENIYGLYRIDLSRGTWEVFHEKEDICNTHVQFEPSEGNDLLVQHNRGAIRGVRNIGPEGCTLYVIDRDGKNFRQLPVGKPWTAPADGHECWIARTGKILLTIDDTRANGCQCIVAPGDKEVTRISRGYHFIHVSASMDGRFYAAGAGGDRRVLIGSIETGRVLPLCETRSSTSGTPHYTWPEPYITPGNRDVIFNSDRTGIGQLYAAEVPDHVMAHLTERM
jgi:hypothetical protein